MVVFICGFMGCGKTTLVNKFKNSSLRGQVVQFIDLDEEILSLELNYKTIDELVKERGWEYFRSKELSMIECYCAKAYQQDYVVALGGGALSEAALKKIKASKFSKLLWMNTPFEKCYERIEGDELRPLVKRGEEFLQNLHEQRLENYKKADLEIDESLEIRQLLDMLLD